MSPYTLPEGNVQISFSGGRTSAYMLHEIVRANVGLPDRVKVIFANTGREMSETLDFVQECSSRWGVPVLWVEDAQRGGEAIYDVVSHNSASRNGEPFDRLLRRKKACPDQSKRFCTEELKVLPARRYLLGLGWSEWTNTIGYRADEPQRIKPSQDKRITRWFPLVAALVTKRSVMDWWRQQPFDLRVPDGMGNCDGCFLKSEATLAALARDFPERHAWWERAEATASQLAASGSARFRSEYTRAELRDYVSRQGDWIFETEGALCQASGGECIES